MFTKTKAAAALATLALGVTAFATTSQAQSPFGIGAGELRWATRRSAIRRWAMAPTSCKRDTAHASATGSPNTPIGDFTSATIWCAGATEILVSD